MDEEKASLKSWKSVKVQGPDSAGIATLVLNSPSRANALNDVAFRELPLAIQELGDDTSVRVIILSAAGKNFCAGIDLGTLSDQTAAVDDDSSDDHSLRRKRTDFGKERETFRRKVKLMQDAFTAFERCRKPVISVIHGACVGAGVDFITACDLRYCTEDAKFSVREVNLGITADLGTLQRLPHIIGYPKAMELALTARTFNGKEAKVLGLVNDTFPSQEMMEMSVREIAGQIAEKSPLAIMGTKAVLQKSRDLSITEGLDYVATWNAAFLWPDDVKEAMMAAMEKRKPVFSRL